MASLLVGAAPMAALAPNLSFSRSSSLTGAVLSIKSPAPASALSSSVTAPTLPLIYCGRGDRKTAKGKRFSHSFGNARPKNKKKGRGPPRVPPPPSGPKKDAFDDGQVVKIEIDESFLS